MTDKSAELTAAAAADLELALVLADAADAITTAAFTGEPLPHRTKADGSPVTETDEAVEQALRTIVAGQRPRDRFLGEEKGEDPRSDESSQGIMSRRWIVDPVDGTANFMAGNPVWATFIGLEEHGELTVGAISAPAFTTRWWGAAGLGAFERVGDRPPRPLAVSTTDQLSDARWACHPDVDGLPESARGLAIHLDEQARQVPAAEWTTHPAFMVVKGSLDLFLQPDGAAWDYAAPAAVIRAAGGDFCYLDGSRTLDFGLEGPRPALFSNGRLAGAALALLG